MKMRYYTVNAKAKAYSDFMVKANSPEEALEKAQRLMETSYEEEWGLTEKKLLPETLTDGGEVVPFTLP